MAATGRGAESEREEHPKRIYEYNGILTEGKCRPYVNKRAWSSNEGVTLRERGVLRKRS